MPTRTTMAIASTSAGPRSASHRSVSRLALGGCLCVAVLGVVLLAPTECPSSTRRRRRAPRPTRVDGIATTGGSRHLPVTLPAAQ